MVFSNKDFRLNAFRELYDALKVKNQLVNFFLKNLLLYLEDRHYDDFIEVVVREQVDQAVEEYHEQMDQIEPMVPPPVYTETYTEASVSLPEMRLTAPWHSSTKEG